MKNLNEVKTRLEDDVFRDLKVECRKADISHSKLLKTLAVNWLRERQCIEGAAQEKGPSAAPKWALPGAHSRVNYGVAPVRLRV